MKIKTSELTGAALDWAGAEGAGQQSRILLSSYTGARSIQILPPPRDIWRNFCPSTDWAQGGPLIESEHIHLAHHRGSADWSAHVIRGIGVISHMAFGPTPLIAGMRCYVASRLGDEVDVPEEML